MSAVELTLPIPVQIAKPEQSYDKVAIQLSLSTMEAMPPIGGALDANLSAMLKPYRVLLLEIDGIMTEIADFAPQAFWRQLSIGSLAEAAVSENQALISAIGAIQGALQAYINSALQPEKAQQEPQPEPCESLVIKEDNLGTVENHDL